MKMKKLLVSGILTLGFVGVGFAAQNQGSGTNVSVDVQNQGTSTQVDVQVGASAGGTLPADIQTIIQQIKNAPESERYIYMNQLKMKLRELSAEERHEIMKEIMDELHEGREEKSEHYVDMEKTYEHEMEMEDRNEHAGMAQEKLMEREHELEERKSEFQERSNFRYQEREEREVEREYEERHERDWD